MTSVMMPTGTYGTDHAGTPNYRVLKSLGYDWDSAYLGGKFDESRSTIEAAWDVGIVNILNYERTPDLALGGYEAGKRAAETALQQASDDGWNWDCPIIFSGVDFDIQPSQYPAADQFTQATLDIIPAEFCGGYGGRKYIEHLATWVPDEFILWQAAGWRYNADASAKWIKQYVGFPSGFDVHQSGNTPDPRIGCLIDENKLFRPVRMWTGDGPDNPPDPDPIITTHDRRDNIMSSFRHLPNGDVYELSMGYKTHIPYSYWKALGGTIAPDWNQVDTKVNDGIVSYPAEATDLANIPDYVAGSNSVPPHSHSVSGTAQ